MTDKPKRRFWQIHLSTAVVMMLVCSGFIWLNTMHCDGEGRITDIQDFWHAGKYPNESLHQAIVRIYGWPSAVYAQITITDGTHPRAGFDDSPILWPGVFRNIGVLLIILGPVTFIMEYLIRRRAKP